MDMFDESSCQKAIGVQEKSDFSACRQGEQVVHRRGVSDPVVGACLECPSVLTNSVAGENRTDLGTIQPVKPAIAIFRHLRLKLQVIWVLCVRRNFAGLCPGLVGGRRASGARGGPAEPTSFELQPLDAIAPQEHRLGRCVQIPAVLLQAAQALLGVQQALAQPSGRAVP